MRPLGTQLGTGALTGARRRVFRAASGPATITLRAIAYLNSVWDGNSATVGANTANAIPPNKLPLLPGQTATLSNISTYDKGLNCIVVEGPHSLTANDLTIEVAPGIQFTTPPPPDWGAGPAPTVTTVAGKHFITFGTSAVNAWLRVTVAANANTGLESPDVFHFGSLPGETSGNAQVSSADTVQTRNQEGNAADIESAFDHDRDGTVTAADTDICNNNIFWRIPLFTA